MLDEDRELLKEVHGDLYEDLIRVYSLRTVCEVLREIYWGVEDELIREKSIDAMMMVKRIVAKLRWYQIEYGTDVDKGEPIAYVENPYATPELRAARLARAIEAAKQK
jgi:hypothetical protein